MSSEDKRDRVTALFPADLAAHYHFSIIYSSLLHGGGVGGGGGGVGGEGGGAKSSASMSDCSKRLANYDIFMLPCSRLQSAFSVAPALKARKVDGGI